MNKKCIYRAKDYEEIIALWQMDTWTAVNSIMLSALQIAANVMKPGLIERHCAGGDLSAFIKEEAADIRKALVATPKSPVRHNRP